MCLGWAKDRPCRATRMAKTFEYARASSSRSFEGRTCSRIIQEAISAYSLEFSETSEMRMAYFQNGWDETLRTTCLFARECAVLHILDILFGNWLCKSLNCRIFIHDASRVIHTHCLNIADARAKI